MGAWLAARQRREARRGKLSAGYGGEPGLRTGDEGGGEAARAEAGTLPGACRPFCRPACRRQSMKRDRISASGTLQVSSRPKTRYR